LHANEDGPTSVRDIAERTALPQPYLEQILLALKGAGLVKSKRGVGGGYILAKTAGEIRISEIISAVDGPISVGDFGEPHKDGACDHDGQLSVGDFGEPHKDGACDHDGQCVLLAVWNLASEHMREHLAKYTLEEIAAISNGEAAWPSPKK